jgi:hypothetical protein
MSPTLRGKNLSPRRTITTAARAPLPIPALVLRSPRLGKGAGCERPGFGVPAVERQTMYGMSAAFVGYAKSTCFRSSARMPKRTATANTLITSSA